MRLSLSVLVFSCVAAQGGKKPDQSLWFFGQKYASNKLKMLSSSPTQIIEQIFQPEDAAVKAGSVWHIQSKFKNYWKEIMDDINALYIRCGVVSNNYKGMPLNVYKHDHSVFAVRQHIWWLRDQFVGELKEEILASTTCSPADKQNAWRLIDSVHTKVQNLGYQYCKKQNPEATECTPGKQLTWFGFENKRTLANRLENIATGVTRRRVGMKRNGRSTNTEMAKSRSKRDT